MALLSLLFSETAWHHFMQIALGLGSTFIPRHEERKSMSTERTFKELSKPDEQLLLCRKLCEDVAEDLKKEGLKGKTITLKLKNVNFEVKTKAQTLPYAVATAEDIFAVAKDLLKMEIENESPQPLRLRLMGVRISAFVNVEDKTPMQKSIIGFLQPGKTDCSRSSQIIHQHLGKEQLTNHPVQTSQPLAHLAGQNDHRQEEACWQIEQGRSEKRQTDEKPQESFFQRARAKRLQLLAANSHTQAEGCGEDISKMTSMRNDSKEGGESSQSNNSSVASDLTENKSVISVQAHSSTSGCGTQTESLTCPVCFKQVRTTDLNIFNRHIDRCLNDDAGKLNKRSSAAQLDPENQKYETVHEQNEAHKVKNEQSLKSKELESSETCLREGQHSLKDNSAQNESPIEGDNKPGTSQEHQSRGKSPVLVCPVCQVTQDTDDLAVFNRHVDLCLNQEVLHELRGQTTFTRRPSAVKNSETKDSRLQLSRQGSKGKNKRRDTPSSPPSKKAKSGSSCNTIDKFFR